MTHASSRTQPFWRLVEESLSEASYLWARLDSALQAHDYTLAEVQTWVEGRLLGALDGVRLGGAAAIAPLIAPGLQDADQGVVSVAAYLLSLLADTEAERTLEGGLREASGETVQAFTRGLGRAGRVEALHELWGRVEDAAPCARAAVLEALSFNGEAPETDWTRLLAHDEPQLRRAAAQALRYLAGPAFQQVADYGLYSEDLQVRNLTISAGIAGGNAHCWQRCVSLVRAPDTEGVGTLLPLVALLGSPRDQEAVFQARTIPELSIEALWALGFVGTLPAVETCLKQMRSGTLSQQAAEAFCCITGLDLARERLVTVPLDEGRDAGEDEDEAPEEGPLLTSDTSLPVPDVDGLLAWWSKNKANFSNDARYLRGRAVSWGSLREALDHVSTRRRHAIAVELSARSGGALALQPFAFPHVQRTQLQNLAPISDAALRNTSRALGFATFRAA